jgi:hypothetical protein
VWHAFVVEQRAAIAGEQYLPAFFLRQLQDRRTRSPQLYQYLPGLSHCSGLERWQYLEGFAR